jgi:hypothetical protein
MYIYSQTEGVFNNGVTPTTISIQFHIYDHRSSYNRGLCINIPKFITISKLYYVDMIASHPMTQVWLKRTDQIYYFSKTLMVTTNANMHILKTRPNLRWDDI